MTAQVLVSCESVTFSEGPKHPNWNHMAEFSCIYCHAWLETNPFTSVQMQANAKSIILRVSNQNGISCPKKFLNHPSLPTFLEIGNTTVPFSSSVRSLGVTLDPTLSFQQHISNVCRSAYLELRKISSVRHLLSAEATTTLVCAFIFPKLDYCNSLLAGLPKHLIHRLQRIQNNAAHLVCKSSKFEHVSPLLHSLHWLPISDRIYYKISSLTHSAICGTGPNTCLN